MKTRKFLSLALALVLCLGLLPTSAGAVDYTITEVTSHRYGVIYAFEEDLAPVCEGDPSPGFGKWGYIDKTGKEVIPCQYIYAAPFSEGMAAVRVEIGKDETYGFPIYKYGFIDKTGKEVIPCQYHDVGSFSGGLAAVLAVTGKDEHSNWIYKWGFIDKTGKEVVPCQYDEVENLSQGLAAIAVATGEKSESGSEIYQWSLVDATGREVIPYVCDSIGSFSEDLIAVELDGKYGFIDKTGKEVIPFKYDGVRSFSEGLAAVGITTGEKDDWGKPICKWGFIDKTGKEVAPCKYDDAYDFSEGLAQVKINDKWGYIDKTGREAVPCKYDIADNFSEGLARVGLATGEEALYGRVYKFGFVDKTGKEVVPCQYNNAGPFSEGLAAVRLDGKWGYINKAGKEVIPRKYDWAKAFGNGFAEVHLGDNAPWGSRSGIIDKTGKEVTPCIYDGEMWEISAHYAVVCMDDEWGLISINAAPTAQPSTQTVTVDGKSVEFAMYALNGGSTNYIRVRDLAALLNGTAAQFDVGWNGSVTLTGKTPYTGSTDKAPFHTEMPYTVYTSPTYVNGKAVDLNAIQIAYNGGGYTYYKLRDLAQALGFNVGWSAEKGVYVETDKPYDPNN